MAEQILHPWWHFSIIDLVVDGFSIRHATLPQDCARISAKELIFISKNIIQDNTIEEIVPKVPPYLAMVKSMKVWAGVNQNSILY